MASVKIRQNPNKAFVLIKIGVDCTKPTTLLVVMPEISDKFMKKVVVCYHFKDMSCLICMPSNTKIFFLYILGILLNLKTVMIDDSVYVVGEKSSLVEQPSRSIFKKRILKDDFKKVKVIYISDSEDSKSLQAG